MISVFNFDLAILLAFSCDTIACTEILNAKIYSFDYFWFIFAFTSNLFLLYFCSPVTENPSALCMEKHCLHRHFEVVSIAGQCISITGLEPGRENCIRSIFQGHNNKKPIRALNSQSRASAWSH